MAGILAPDLENKAASVRAFLNAAVREHGRVIYANSLGSGAIYGQRIRLVYSDSRALQTLVSVQGANGFRRSVEARLSCCGARKIEPFKNAIAGFKAWVTGVRREQSPTRALSETESGMLNTDSIS